MDIYAQNILDHYKHPHHAGRLPSPSVSRHEANHSCGDAMTVDLALEGDRITDVRFEGSGCAISQAAMSILSDELPGRSADDLGRMTEADLHRLLGVEVTARRRKCALLSLLTVKNALRSHAGLPALAWTDLVDE